MYDTRHFATNQEWSAYAGDSHLGTDDPDPSPTLSNFLLTFTGILPGTCFPVLGRGQPSPWTPRAQGALATMETARRLLVDLRKADVTARHLAWQGALHEITNQTW